MTPSAKPHDHAASPVLCLGWSARSCVPRGPSLTAAPSTDVPMTGRRTNRGNASPDSVVPPRIDRPRETSGKLEMNDRSGVDAPQRFQRKRAGQQPPHPPVLARLAGESDDGRPQVVGGLLVLGAAFEFGTQQLRGAVVRRPHPGHRAARDAHVRSEGEEDPVKPAQHRPLGDKLRDEGDRLHGHDSDAATHPSERRKGRLSGPVGCEANHIKSKARVSACPRRVRGKLSAKPAGTCPNLSPASLSGSSRMVRMAADLHCQVPQGRVRSRCRSPNLSGRY